MTTSTSTSDRYEKYVSGSEAARIIGISRQSVSNLIGQGYFTTKAVAGRILLLREEVETFPARPRGRPVKGASSVRRRTPIEIPNDKLGKKYVTQAEAARIRAVSPQAISKLVHRDRLNAITVAGRILLLRSEVEAFVPRPISHSPKKGSKGAPTKKTP